MEEELKVEARLVEDCHLQWTDGFRILKKNSVMEALSWVCARTQHNHEWISEFSLVLQENRILAALH